MRGEGWSTGYHEGWLYARVPDGRLSLDLREGSVVVEGVSGAYPRHPDRRDCEIVPDDDVTGWCAACACGWKGPLWDRIPVPEAADLKRRRVYVPFLGVAVPSVDVEAAMRQEWESHAIPARAVSELQAAARAAGQAQARLDRGVQAARAAGVTWAGVAAVVGISRQSAHQRWSTRP